MKGTETFVSLVHTISIVLKGYLVLEVTVLNLAKILAAHRIPVRRVCSVPKAFVSRHQPTNARVGLVVPSAVMN